MSRKQPGTKALACMSVDPRQIEHTESRSDVTFGWDGHCTYLLADQDGLYIGGEMDGSFAMPGGPLSWGELDEIRKRYQP